MTGYQRQSTESADTLRTVHIGAVMGFLYGCRLGNQATSNQVQWTPVVVAFQGRHCQWQPVHWRTATGATRRVAPSSVDVISLHLARAPFPLATLEMILVSLLCLFREEKFPLLAIIILVSFAYPTCAPHYLHVAVNLP